MIEGGTPDRPTRSLVTLRHDGPGPAGAQAYRSGVSIDRALPVQLHTIDSRAELMANGRAGTRPDVSPLVVQRYRPRYVGRRKLIGYDPIYETAPGVVALQRATYAAWHCALTLLVERLEGLDRYRVTGPAASSAAP